MIKLTVTFRNFANVPKNCHSELNGKTTSEESKKVRLNTPKGYVTHTFPLLMTTQNLCLNSVLDAFREPQFRLVLTSLSLCL